MIKQGDITYIKFTRILRIAKDLIVTEARKMQEDFQPSDYLPVDKDLNDLVNTVIDFFSCSRSRRNVGYFYMEQVERRGVEVPTYHIWIRDEKERLLAEIDCHAYKRLEIRFYNPEDQYMRLRDEMILTKDSVTGKGKLQYSSHYGEGCDLDYLDALAWPTDIETSHQDIYRRISVSALIKERYDEPSLSPAYRVRLDEKEFIEAFLEEAKEYYSDYLERN